MTIVGEEVRERRNGWGLTPGYERGCSSEEGVWEEEKGRIGSYNNKWAKGVEGKINKNM